MVLSGRNWSYGHARAVSPKPEIEIEDEAYQPEDIGPAQAPPNFTATLVLQDTMARILSFLEGMSQLGILPVTLDGSHGRVRTHTSNQVPVQGFQTLGS
ncbi:hypothetical protein HAX54_010698 [Datura stramonium]|uniref:Uncharacterized protein n=1 Tax=Datura stramonium TaxID=4076 RepID=A0ABS8TIL2_DATST|nr:hypothetical protein [Datura stramonium]